MQPNPTCLYRISGNDFLVAQIMHLKNRLKPYRRLPPHVRKRIAQTLSEQFEQDKLAVFWMHIWADSPAR